MADTEPDAQPSGGTPPEPPVDESAAPVVAAGEDAPSDVAPAAPEAEPEAAEAEAPPGLRVEITPEDAPTQAEEQAWTMLLRHPVLQRALPGGDLWMVGFDLLDKEPGPAARFSAEIVDATTGRALTAFGVLDDRESIVVRHREAQHPPRDDEHGFAAGIVSDDEEWGPGLQDGSTELYRPIPPLANVAEIDGTVERVVTVGLRATGGAPRHRTVGVRTRNGEVVREPVGAIAASDEECGAPPGPQQPIGEGANQARVKLFDGADLLWDLVVVRPSASSGTNGSGLELREVTFKGQPVLSRAHVPIVTVDYDGDGPTYRSWLNDEASFHAEGDDPVTGFRLCTAAPGTLLETGVDGGGFRGVAVWLDDQELVLVSQVQAGWDRYVTEWRLHADGSLRPRLGVAAASNPLTCRPHRHHAYWRLDFDIAGPAANLVQEFNDPPVVGVTSWLTTRFEVTRPRDPSRRRSWRVRSTRSGMGYWVQPGPRDGTADFFGAGDVWLLRHQDGELDDGQGVTFDPVLARAGLDRLVTGDPLHDVDVVVWYAAHVAHDGGPLDEGRVGPDLVPFNWRAARAREPYPDLVP